MPTTAQATDTIQLRRSYSAPIDAVWHAWTSPEALTRWFRPSDEHTTTVHALELRVGGKYRIEMVHTSGKRHVVAGAYRELQPPGLLAFTWRWEDNPVMSDTLVTVELRAQGGGTELVLTHRMLVEEKQREDHRHGWSRCLERLGAIL
jgi:uncharacterized protein YndB with AHSA1/START domain